jgi:hypothetical protein
MRLLRVPAARSQFTCFTGTKVQILTPVAADIYGHYIVPSLLALLVQRYT